MSKQQMKAISNLTLALTICLGFAAQDAGATKMNAAPLPHEREAKNFGTSDGETVISRPSRFQRRLDYREIEAQKKQEEEEAAKKSQQAQVQAAVDRKRASDEAIENYKKRQEMAIDANNKAVAFGKTGHWPDALTAHERAVQLDPQNKQFQINLSAARVEYGKAKANAGDLTAAAGLFRKALSAAPDNGLAGKLLAQVMAKQGRDPMSADIRLATGDQLAAIGDYEGASIEYQAAMQLEPTARCYTKMGDMALQYGQLGTALNWYRQAIVKDTNFGGAHRQLGLILLSQKDNTGAAASLRKAVILDPKDSAAGQYLVEIWRKQVATNPLLAENHLGLAGALQLTGDYNGAESEYRRLEALDPKNPGLESGRISLARTIQHDKAEKHKLAAETLFNQGLRREALAEISQAVMVEPRNAKYQFLLGECLEANGDFQGAHQAYLTCVLIDPENNQEAATRMKQMEGNRRSTATPRTMQQQQQQQQQQMQQYQMQQQHMQQQMQQPVAAMQSPMNAGAQPNMAMPRKDMFEAAPATQQSAQQTAQPLQQHAAPVAQPAAVAAQPAAAAQTQNAATSKASRAAVKQAVEAQQAVPAMTSELKEADAKVSEAESQHDYQRAVVILKDLVTNHLQNPNVHHRLAVNLLNCGDIEEAVAEFRIASALNPNKKEFAEDLAQAMIIHKRALTSQAGADNSGANAGATK